MSTNPIVLVKEALATTSLTAQQKLTVSGRFISLLYEYNGRSNRYSFSFNTLRIIITVGSLIVPALLSVQYASGNVNSSTASISSEVYWFVWVLSLLVTISNGVMTLLKVDKKYFTLNTTYQHLLSEGWQFVHLSGKYSGFYTPSAAASHQNQFIYFCNMIEKIRMKQVEEEYYKLDQSHGHGTPHDQLVPPTPAAIKNGALLPFSDQDSEEKTSIIINDDSDNSSKIFFKEPPPKQGTTVRKKHPPAAVQTTPGAVEQGGEDERS